MKKTIVLFLALIVGDILCAKYFHDQSVLRFLALIGFLVVAVTVFIFTANLTTLITGLINNKNNVSENKYGLIYLAILFFLIGIHVWGFIAYTGYQEELLISNGIKTKTLITDVTYEERGKGGSSNYVHYSYLYENEEYFHDCKNDSLEVGDTVTILFLPDNPDNHKIIND